MMLNKIILLLALFTMPVYANTTCKQLAEVAGQFMEKRQASVDLLIMVKALEKSGAKSQIIYDLLYEIYDTPVYMGKDMQRKAVSEAISDTYLACARNSR